MVIAPNWSRDAVRIFLSGLFSLIHIPNLLLFHYNNIYPFCYAQSIDDYISLQKFIFQHSIKWLQLIDREDDNHFYWRCFSTFSILCSRRITVLDNVCIEQFLSFDRITDFIFGSANPGMKLNQFSNVPLLEQHLHILHLLIFLEHV